MSLLVRKIALNKWMKTDILNGALPSADAITGCTRTRDNTLSVWSIETENELEDAILAIASNVDHLDKIDIVLLDRGSVERRGLPITAVPGDTPYKRFIQKHFDLYELDYGTLGTVSQEIVKSIKMNMCRNFTRVKLKSILVEGVKCGKIDLHDLKDSVRKCISP